ncbi:MULTISPECIES: PH domain-containing protein [unclassified Nonomuraea]|uniref:PH domain-containing protein n=1 Tax=unclassified Nonomuraea TaxID=2593643 RepID=UPI0033D98648
MTWRRLPGRSVGVSAVLSLGAVVAVDVVVVRVLHGLDRPWGTVAAVAGAAAVLIVAAVVAYDVTRLRVTRWRLTRDRLELRSGVLSRRHRSVPRDRVRSVDLRADPVRRAFGLTVVKIGAGGHGDERTELTLDPLPRAEAEALRQALLSGAPAGPFLPAAGWEDLPAASTFTGPGAGQAAGDRVTGGAAQGVPGAAGWPGEGRAARGGPDGREAVIEAGTVEAGAVEAGAVEVVARLRWSWVRYAPLTVWSFAGAAIVLGVLYKPLDALGVEVFSGETAGVVWDWLTERPWVTVPLVVAGNVVAGVSGALLIFVESWGGYRLEREPGRPGPTTATDPDPVRGPAADPARRDGRLRVRRGLLTSRSLTLDEGRLRGVEIREPLLLRLGGGARVKAVATGLGKAEEGETEDVAALTPPLPRGEAARVAARIAGGPLPEPVPHPAAARRRRVRRALAAVVAPAAALAIAVPVISRSGWSWASEAGAWTRAAFTEAWVWGVAACVTATVLAAALWLAVAGYRGLGHALGGRHLVARSGAVVRRTVALDRGGIVGWKISQSYVQRRAGLLTVSATTAAGDGHYDVVDVGRAAGLELAAGAVPGLLGPFLVRDGGAEG